LAFRAAFGNDTDNENCLKESVQYLRTVFEKSADDINKDCTRYAANSRRCIELAAK